MAVSIPSSPKLYTTKYDNFKGVDMTNDPSNTWYRRTPNGVNMLPDVDGRPFKRTGWDVLLEEDAYYFESSQTMSLIPDRLFYFELNGFDHIVIFNSMGLFMLMDERNPNVPSDNTIVKSGYESPNGNEYTLVYHKGYYDSSNTFVTTSAFDSNRAFFFEGGGDAGFYVFLKDQNKMVSFSLSNTTHPEYFCEAEPYVPKVLYLCTKDGYGTYNEPVNMLTAKRTIGYANDEDNVTEFKLPQGMKFTGDTIVEVRTADGGWSTLSSGYSGGGINTTSITFSTQPTAYVEGEDNIRVTFTPVGEGVSVATRSKTTTLHDIAVIRYRAYKQRCTNPDNEATIDQNELQWTRWDRGSATFDASNMAQGTSSVLILQGSSWSTLSSSYYTASYNAYDSTVLITGNESLFNSVQAPTTTTTEATAWTRGTSGDDRNYYFRTYKTTDKKTYRLKHSYSEYYITSGGNISMTAERSAFWGCTKALIFGNGIINQVFLTGSSAPNYTTRVWYSGATKPTYFADTNYIEVGATDKPVMGLIKVGEYLGIVKSGGGTDASIYLGYPTSYDEETTYAVKQSIGGIGAISKGAFNILNDEPLYLSAEGVMGINEYASGDKRLRNRSYFVNKALCSEPNLSTAVSFVYDGMYWLSVNGHCYVLDGSQKNSWANEKTNFQYECYYLDNFPAQCFAKFDDHLWFTDFTGKLCVVKKENDKNPYRDRYSLGRFIWTTSSDPTEASGVKSYARSAITKDSRNSIAIDYDYVFTESGTVSNTITELPEYLKQGDPFTVEFSYGGFLNGSANFVYGTASTYLLAYRYDGDKTISITSSSTGTHHMNALLFDGDPKVGENIKTSNGDWYTITEVHDSSVVVADGVSVNASWATLYDDDGSVNYYKNFQKKGCLVSLLPASNSGVEVWLNKDEDDPIFFGETDSKGHFLPSEYYIKKKIKKYKRLQILCKNENLDQSFGIDEIIKMYTFGNYSKNRGGSV